MTTSTPGGHSSGTCLHAISIATPGGTMTVLNPGTQRVVGGTSETQELMFPHIEIPAGYLVQILITNSTGGTCTAGYTLIGRKF